MQEHTAYAIGAIGVAFAIALTVVGFHYFDGIETEKAMKAGLEQCPKYDRDIDVIWVKSCKEYMITSKEVYGEI